MNTKSKSISTPKFILKYGLILGGIWIAYYFVKYLITDSIYAKSDDTLSNIIEIVLYLTLIYPVYRYKLMNNGFISLIQALKIAIGIAIIVSLIKGSYVTFIIKIVKPEEVLNRINKAQEAILENNPGMSTQEIQKTIKANKTFSSFYLHRLFNFVFDLTLSFIISLITGTILRKKKTL